MPLAALQALTAAHGFPGLSVAKRLELEALQRSKVVRAVALSLQGTRCGGDSGSHQNPECGGGGTGDMGTLKSLDRSFASCKGSPDLHPACPKRQLHPLLREIKARDQRA